MGAVAIQSLAKTSAKTAGLLAAAALMIDYILNAAVGISAGVEALVSAFPSLLPHTLTFCLAILALLTLINIRGTKDTGIAFLIPTYMFIGTLISVIGIGVFRAIGAHGQPTPIVAPPFACRHFDALPLAARQGVL
jgi:amino acid transporter